MYKSILTSSKVRNATTGQNISNSEIMSVEQSVVNDMSNAPSKYLKVMDLFMDIVLPSSKEKNDEVSSGFKVKCSWRVSANR